MTILEENFKWNLEAFASELFNCILIVMYYLHTDIDKNIQTCKNLHLETIYMIIQ